jgi:predicted ester cyclase
MRDRLYGRAQENARLVRRFYDEMWNRFDTSVIPAIAHPDIRFRGSLGQEKRGHEGLAEYVRFVQAAFPDFHNEIIETVTEGNRTAARLSYTGTHLGEVFGIAATGRRVCYAGVAFFVIGGKGIEQVWVLGDVYGLLQQLRAIH